MGEGYQFDTVNIGKSALDAVFSKDKRKLYVAAGNDGIVIINIGDQSSGETSKIIHKIATPGIAHSVALSEDEKYLYVVDGKAGVIVVTLE
jgi:hypothetical protein